MAVLALARKAAVADLAMLQAAAGREAALEACSKVAGAMDREGGAMDREASEREEVATAVATRRATAVVMRTATVVVIVTATVVLVRTGTVMVIVTATVMVVRTATVMVTVTALSVVAVRPLRLLQLRSLAIQIPSLPIHRSFSARLPEKLPPVPEEAGGSPWHSQTWLRSFPS